MATPDPAPDADSTPRLYDELASWWPLVSAPEDYAEEAAFFAQALEGAAPSDATTLLELGSGGGNNASHLCHRFAMTLVDRSPGMLAVSRVLNPDCEHIEGDMRNASLGRTFDRVFVHDALAYMTSEDDLRAVAATAFAHCTAGGAALLAPDFVRETFRPTTSHGGHDGTGDDRRCLRYLAWSHEPAPGAVTFDTDYVFALCDGDGPLRIVQDRHVEGLFPRDTWLEILTAAGFDARAQPYHHSTFDDGPRDVFVAVRR